MKTVWLLEHKFPDGTVYWGHFANCKAWTKDINMAVRFADERSAELVRTYIESDSKFVWVPKEFRYGFDDETFSRKASPYDCG